MRDERVISATFSDWRCVKGRKVLQLVFEVPIEQQTEVLTLLGPPGIAEDKWVAIALLNEKPKIEVGPTDRPIEGNNGHAKLATEPGNRETAGTSKPDRRPFHTLPLAQQAGIRGADPTFREYIILKHNALDSNSVDYIRVYCSIESRAELGKGNHEADNRWRQLNSAFEAWQTDQKYADSRR